MGFVVGTVNSPASTSFVADQLSQNEFTGGFSTVLGDGIFGCVVIRIEDFVVWVGGLVVVLVVAVRRVVVV